MTRFRSIKVDGLKVGMQGSHGQHGIWAETKTDAEGRFEFTGLAEGTANIFLTDHPNDGPWTYRAAADTRLAAGPHGRGRDRADPGCTGGGQSRRCPQRQSRGWGWRRSLRPDETR